MTKSELIKRVANHAEIPKIIAEIVVNTIFNSMKESLAKGDHIEIRGFGSFNVRKYKAYKGRNPKTGDLVKVKSKKLPAFRAGKELKERVNKL